MGLQAVPKAADLSDVLKIYVNAGDHAPPHFHVVGPEIDFTVRISDFRVLAGIAGRKELAVVVSWASRNAELLMRKWVEYNERD